MRRTKAKSRAVRTATMLAVAGTLSLSVDVPLARAQDPADLPPRPGDRGALTAGTAEALSGYWRQGEPRAFASALIELGVLYYRPGMAVGYGKPHYRWIGFDGHVTMSQSGAAEYVGIRGVVPRFEARAGTRYQAPISQYFLTRQSTYTREDTEVDLHGRSRYMALESELSGSVPMPGGALIAVLSGYVVLGVPEDLYVFEEALKVVIDPPYLWRARLGYLASLGWGDERPDTLRIGAAAEVIHSVGREDVVVRTGPLISVLLTCHLEAVGAAMLVVSSPDSLGLQGADFGQIGLRYRWATGEPAPAFP